MYILTKELLTLCEVAEEVISVVERNNLFGLPLTAITEAEGDFLGIKYELKFLKNCNFDGNANLVNHVHPIHRSLISQHFNSDNQLTKRYIGGTLVLTNKYDEEKRLIEVTEHYPSYARSTVYGYDEQGRVSSQVGGNMSSGFSYSADGLTTVLEDDSGSITTTVMSTDGKEKHVVHTHGFTSTEIVTRVNDAGKEVYHRVQGTCFETEYCPDGFVTMRTGPMTRSEFINDSHGNVITEREFNLGATFTPPKETTSIYLYDSEDRLSEVHRNEQVIFKLAI